jgi:hypothetical protein
MNDVLYVPVSVQKQSTLSLLSDVYSIVDEESQRILDLLRDLEILSDSTPLIDGIGVMELPEDIPFVQIAHILEREDLAPVSPNLCLYFLSMLKAGSDTSTPHSFFDKGMVLLSTEPIIIQGKLHYLVIGQSSCDQKKNQKIFSFRLLTPPKIFLHSLYRVLVAKTAISV